MSDNYKETELYDVSGATPEEVLTCEKDDKMKKSIEIITAQVVQPRHNLGGAGPPGRAD